MFELTVIQKDGFNKYRDTYFDVIEKDVGPILMKLSDNFLLTKRGVYTEFDIPNRDYIAPIHTPSVAYEKMKGSIIPTSSKYMDIVLDLNKPSEYRVYEDCMKQAGILKEALIKSLTDIYNDDSDDHNMIIQYISKNIKRQNIEDFLDDEINIMFIKDHSTNPKIKYIHLKVVEGSATYDTNGIPVSMENIMYKTFRTKIGVIVDNIRIPKTRNSNNRLNVHLAVYHQIVSEF